MGLWHQWLNEHLFFAIKFLKYFFPFVLNNIFANFQTNEGILIVTWISLIIQVHLFADPYLFLDLNLEVLSYSLLFQPLLISILYQCTSHVLVKYVMTLVNSHKFKVNDFSSSSQLLHFLIFFYVSKAATQ